MKQFTKYNLIFYSALVSAIWFMLTSALWTLLMNLVISFPFGLLSLLLWYSGKRMDDRKKRYNTILIILLIGVLVSAASLVYFWMYE